MMAANETLEGDRHGAEDGDGEDEGGESPGAGQERLRH